MKEQASVKCLPPCACRVSRRPVRFPRSPSLVVGIALLATAVLLTACSGSSDRGPLCVGGPTEPVTVDELTAALERRGVTLKEDNSSALCSARGLVADLVNSDSDREKAGVMGCAVRRKPIYADPSKLRKEVSPDKVEFFLANVECSVYPRGEIGLQRVIDVERALGELKGQL